MRVPAKYFHDRSVLLLLTINVFLALLLALLTLFRLDSYSSGSSIVQYRSSLGLSGYRAGGSIDFVAFILFGILVVAANIALSLNVYEHKRKLSVSILSLSLIILIFSLIVSNSLLNLR